jgi:hypothetical protein
MGDSKSEEALTNAVIVPWNGQYTRVLSVLVSQAEKRGFLSEEDEASYVPSANVYMTLLGRGHSCCW